MAGRLFCERKERIGEQASVFWFIDTYSGEDYEREKREENYFGRGVGAF